MSASPHIYPGDGILQIELVNEPVFWCHPSNWGRFGHYSVTRTLSEAKILVYTSGRGAAAVAC